MTNFNLKKTLLKYKVFIITLIVMLPLRPFLDDGFRAYNNTESGDRWRLFQYYQTARFEGVPAALEKHGVK